MSSSIMFDCRTFGNQSNDFVRLSTPGLGKDIISPLSSNLCKMKSFIFINYDVFEIKTIKKREINHPIRCCSILLLKLINYSCSQKPINDLHLGQVDES